MGNLEERVKVFLICPIRGASPEVQEILEGYVSTLESAGYKVHYPARDTEQVDPEGGINICLQNTSAIIEADEVHIYWDPNSGGSKFDLGATIALRKPLFLVNPWDISRTEAKSFENVVISYAKVSPYAPYSLENLQQDAGEELADVMLELFVEEKEALKWFYTAPVPALSGKTPFEVCSGGEREKVERLVYGLMHGVFQ